MSKETELARHDIDTRQRPALLATVLLVGALILAGLPTTAQADEASDRAIRFHSEARRLYSQGKFKAAASFFQKAYDIKPHHSFLYNLAQCHRHLETLEHQKKAVFFYKQYLGSRTDAPDRQKVKQTIAELNRRIEELKKEQKKRAELLLGTRKPPKPRPTPERKPFYKKWWFWTAVGAVVVGTGVGIGVGVSSRGEVPGGPEISCAEKCRSQ